MSKDPGEITALLQAHATGEAEALERLLALVYDELRRVARGRLRREPGHTLAPTELVHQALLKLVPLDRIEWQDRAHFFAIASRAMRNVLIDHAERRRTAKRGGGVGALPLEAAASTPESRGIDLDDLIALGRALERLEQLDPRQARVVECRYFGGLSIEETALALDISAATVSRDWTFARAWLHRELAAGSAEVPP